MKTSHWPTASPSKLSAASSTISTRGRSPPPLPPRFSGVRRSRLYEWRTAWLRERDGFAPTASGGDRHKDWPPAAHRFPVEFLPLQNPPDYQLVADELKRLCGLVRAHSSVEAQVKAHYAHLVPSPARQPRVYRRFRRARQRRTLAARRFHPPVGAGHRQADPPAHRR